MIGRMRVDATGSRVGSQIQAGSGVVLGLANAMRYPVNDRAYEG
jgi:hypothetical protein